MRRHKRCHHPPRGPVRWAAVWFVFAGTLLSSCGGVPRISPEDPHWVDNDCADIPEPAKRDPGLVWSAIDRSFFDQVEQFFDVSRSLPRLFGKPAQAENINSLDEVPNSSWFINRHGLQPLTPDEILLGPERTLGPDTSGEWTVFRPKVQGATPGFWIKDTRGDQYIIKFDPPGYPEMATAAGAISSRFFYACGYNVPQETIVYWRPEIAKVKEGVFFTDSQGVKREFTQNDLNDILASIHREPDGRIRSLASLLIGSRVKGGFSYSGRRSDDPNDWCPHQNRRELRGLYVMASLVNHYDTKEQNTLDVYEEEDGRHFLRHYLIDFGSTLGSDGDDPKPPVKGYANMVDLRDALVSLTTFGLKTWPREEEQRIRYPSVGYFEADNFRPDKFDPILPNPAFERKTDRDAYWGAKIVMAFRDEHLAALVKAGQFSDPAAEDYLLQTLIKRRDKIGRHWFDKVNPLDRFELISRAEGVEVRFEDLAVKYGLTDDQSTYRLRVRYDGKEVSSPRELTETTFELTASDLQQLIDKSNVLSTSTSNADFLLEVRLTTQRGQSSFSKPTVLYLYYSPEKNQWHLAGVEHRD